MEYWVQKLSELMKGAKPMTRKPMRRISGLTCEIVFGAITIYHAGKGGISHERLNRLDWWDYEVDDSGYDDVYHLEWVVLKTKNGKLINMVFTRRPPQDDSQPALLLPVSGPQTGEGARATAEA